MNDLGDSVPEWLVGGEVFVLITINDKMSAQGGDWGESHLGCNFKEGTHGTSLVVQWLRIYLPRQGTQV